MDFIDLRIKELTPNSSFCPFRILNLFKADECVLEDVYQCSKTADSKCDKSYDFYNCPRYKALRNDIEDQDIIMEYLMRDLDLVDEAKKNRCPYIERKEHSNYNEYRCIANENSSISMSRVVAQCHTESDYCKYSQGRFVLCEHYLRAKKWRLNFDSEMNKCEYYDRFAKECLVSDSTKLDSTQIDMYCKCGKNKGIGKESCTQYQDAKKNGIRKRESKAELLIEKAIKKMQELGEKSE